MSEEKPRSAVMTTPAKERAAGYRTIDEAVRIAKRKGKVVAIKQFSRHPDDDYLYVVLVDLTQRAHTDIPVIPENSFATWLVNTSVAGCGEGHYFSKVSDAMKDFNTRGRYGLPLETEL